MDAMVIRNMKDFQLLFNQMSETCFKTCVNTFMSRDISTEEVQCIENCSGKHINANHKIMEIFMDVQRTIALKNVEEFQKAQAAFEVAQKDQNSESTSVASSAV
ncbi:mitochondrial import inner membrane translocase subunit Tim10B-like [Apis laboriosa]|uniref:Mitochondrial import inner membrane translocase subunit n=1 Tax=Apis mellifera TaxID=7460 RepID=A0A7M7FZZ9_APIME|nr:mitochondrial import inner membrane translocase subunit Tim10B [Apis mellifera]XP_006614211.1 mitochondrial import inner membrane translocase subunit Tim10B-like [Apis dorsata]XP_043803383.1 mitochondrial import inner membrane translocase subunit Tim10B-like [Apis laboriosa]|eukprot:XP_001121893.2 mitochondrial import inner membrane translocase subunit Tim10B [Apis mellifera]